MTDDMAVEILWALGTLVSLIVVVWVAIAPREMRQTRDIAESNRNA